MRYWIITDTHFGHNKLVKDGLRPENFEDKIIRNCVKMIKEDDILIHLGDVSFYNDQYWHELFLTSILSRNNILVRGNHDKRTLSWYYKAGWNFVVEDFTLSIYGEHILFSHRPVFDPKFSMNVHGHLHDSSHRKADLRPYNECVSIEEAMAPFTLRKLVERNLNKRR